MNKSTSLYLDFLRVIAAFGVLFVHANLSWFSNNLFLPEGLGHKLVMIFFVLSGYLIAFTVDKKNKGSRNYLVNRFSRLYSVVLPALIFTYAIDFAGKRINPVFYVSQIDAGYQAIRALITVAFLNQVWGLCVKPSSNGPFWSISYEFCYYMLFWVFCYLKGKTKYIILLFICLIVGIKILLLLPVWVFGVIAYRKSTKLIVGKMPARILFLSTSVFIVILTFYCNFSFFTDKFVYGSPPLFFSSNFIFDWVYGTLIAINIFCSTFLDIFISIPKFINKTIKSLSAMTFSLYLYHFPILIFIGATFSYNKSSYLIIIPILVGVVLIISVLSRVTERQRGKLNMQINKVFLFFGKFNSSIK